MAGNPWFRFYADWMDNPKVQLLPQPLQLVHIKLMCLACKDELDGASIDDLAWACRLPVEIMQQHLARLQDDDLWDGQQVTNWAEKQFKGDCSTERVRRHRERKAAGTLSESETDPDTDSETDTEGNRFPKQNETVSGNGGKQKPAESIPFREIVQFLNQAAGKKFPVDDNTKRHIRARWREGHRLPDFQRVIENRVLAWAGSTKMAEYIRPQTLFGTKFSGYLNSPDPTPPEPTHTSSNKETLHRMLQMGGDREQREASQAAPAGPGQSVLGG